MVCTSHTRPGGSRGDAAGSKSPVFQRIPHARTFRGTPDCRRHKKHRKQILHSAGRNYISRETGPPAGGLGAVAIGAFRRRLLVNDHWLAIHFARLFVTILTRHIRVASLERKFCLHVMIERRGHPALRGVTIGARRFPRHRKLPGVRILVTVFAIPGSAFELYRVGAGRNLMAGATRHGAMRAQERKIRFRVVKPVYVRPRRHAMAGFTSQWRTVCAPLRHALVEFAVVRVRVTRRARAVFESKCDDSIGAAGRPQLVAIRTSHGGVGALQCEARLAMHGDGKGRAVKIADRVAALALVEERSACELAGMGVLVTVHARFEFHFVKRVLAGRDVAPGAFHLDVFAPERIAGGVMFLHAEKRRLPAIDRVAIRALAFLRTRGELPAVRVRLMAIRALRECQRLVEIPARMTLDATDLSVHAEQGILRLGMVECEALLQLLPARRRVAILAAFFERALVRIDVASRARSEIHVRVAGWPSRHVGLVTFFASHLDVQAGERIARLGVIKFLGRLPIHKIVAALTVVAELAFVNIGVARDAILRESEERAGGILHLDERAHFGKHARRRVTFLARKPGMFSHQVVARQAMIELFFRRLPMNQLEVRAVVFQVAAHAVFAIRIRHRKARVIPVLRGEGLSDLLVAIQAFEGRRAGAKFVATRALRCARKALVSFRKRPGRELRPCRWRHEQEQAEANEEETRYSVRGPREV